MSIAYVYKKITALAAATSLDGLSLGGSATSSSSLMDARAEAPLPPKSSSYLPVEDLPAQPEKPTMTPDEQAKLQKELIAARDHLAAAAKSQGPPEPMKL